MRKLIGTIVILLFLYVGFFGCERYNIKPFITEWLSSDKPKELGEDIEKVSGKVKDVADTVVERGDEIINSAVNGK